MPSKVVGNIMTEMDVPKPPKVDKDSMGRGTTESGPPGKTTRLSHTIEEIKKR
jgi:hypothetical protein